MLPCIKLAESLASSMNSCRNSRRWARWGWMTLSAMRLAKPEGPICSASYTVAIPPSATLRTRWNAPWYSRLSFMRRWRVGFDGGVVAGGGAGRACLTNEQWRTLENDPQNSRPDDHRRRAHGPLRDVLCWHARGDGANRRRPGRARRTADGAVPRKGHLRRGRVSPRAGQGTGPVAAR